MILEKITIRFNGPLQYGFNHYLISPDFKLNSITCGGSIPTLDKENFNSDIELIEYLLKYASGMHSKLGVEITLNKDYK